jgi:DNA-binding IclR family transcriptional regulator
VIGVERHETRRIIAQIALDGMTRGRRSVLDAFRRVDREHSLSSIGGRVLLPDTTTRRHIEDLTAHGVLDLVGRGPERWVLSKWTRDQFEALDLPDIGEDR